MKDTDNLREQILIYRAKYNLSQGKFANLCKLTSQTICNIENGTQEPSKLTRQKILNIIKEEKE